MATEPVVTKTTDPSGNAVTTKSWTDANGNVTKEVTTDYGDVSYGDLFKNVTWVGVIFYSLISSLFAFGIVFVFSFMGKVGYGIIALIFGLSLGYYIYSVVKIDRHNYNIEKTITKASGGVEVTQTGQPRFLIYTNFFFIMTGILTCMGPFIISTSYLFPNKKSSENTTQAGGRRKKSRR